MIHIIDKRNIGLLNDFLTGDMPGSFRYFNKRNIDCIENHIVTLIMTEPNVEEPKVIGYGHLDKDGDNIWLGICILPEHQGNKYGDKVLDFLLSYIKENSLQNVRLSVDVDNYKAINLYMKKNFRITKFCDTHYIMEPRNTGNTLSLPVSLGEALDKLTILEIKLDKIKDDRKSDVQKEYDMLHKKLAEYINKNEFHYHTLKRINLSIWELQDKFRYGNSKDKDKICMKIIDENDRRFRVKNKINVSADSELKEQKGYKPKRAFVLTHLGLGDNITSIGAVRYLSTCYDKVIMVCKERNKKNMELFYADDESIVIHPVIDDRNISPRMGFSMDAFKQITLGMDLYLAGGHCFGRPNSYDDIPYNFYRDMKINEEYFWSYFHINTPKESHSLFEKIKNHNYIFIHNTSSNGQAFTIEEVEKKLDINRKDSLIINPCKNVYTPDDDFYELAQEFLNHPLAFYGTIIIHASKVIMTDSSFLCMALNLPIKTNECYLKSRDNRDYRHLYKNVQLDKLNRKRFLQTSIHL